MSDWTSGYVADIGYTFGYYRELAPANLAFTQLIRGSKPLSMPSHYCELGCGQGLSMNLLAASNPQTQFYATDFNPGQIAGARALAESASLQNVHFFDQSFEVFGDEPALPASFDIIALHGIYSWVSAANRDHIVKFIDRKLRPGGVVYISYNCLPGWAGPSPIRELIRIGADGAVGSTEVKIGAALDFVQRVLAATPGYFSVNASSRERAEKLLSQPKNYLAHEYLNADWNLFYHRDVASELANGRLTFIGSAAQLEHVDAINLTADQSTVLASAPDTATRETLRDFMVNQQFRRDVFARGSLPMTVKESQETWLETRFILSTPRDLVPKTATGILGEASLQPEVYDPILDAFAALLDKNGAPSLRQIFTAYPDVSSLGWARVQQAITVLVGMGHLQPCPPDAKGEAARKQSTKRLNDKLIERAQHSAEVQFLASPVTGAGVVVSRFEQLFLLARRNKDTDPVSFVWKTLEGLGQRVVKEGRQLQTEEENRAEIERSFEAFDRRLPVLHALGIA